MSDASFFAKGKNPVGGYGGLKADKKDLTSIFESGSTASQAISAGTYFYLNGVLVKAKTSIAIGATFTEDTNYTVVTAGAINEGKDPYLVASPMVLNTYYNVPRQAKDIIIFFTNSSGNSWSTVFPMIENKVLVIGEEAGAGNLPYVVTNITDFTVMLGRIGTGSSAKLYWR